MQNLTAPPRSHLTAAEVFDLLTGHLTGDLEGKRGGVSVGLELLDVNNGFVADISGALEPDGSTVEHDGHAQVHGSCTLKLLQSLAWGKDRVRPYMTLSNAAVSARFNLGVYVLTTPKTQRGEDPITYTVTGFDLLQPLQEGPGDTFVVVPDAGSDVVTNPGFETDTTGWDSSGAFGAFTPATFARTTAKHDTGVASLEVTWPTTTASSWVNTSGNFIVGKTYKFSARVWVPTGGPTNFRFELVFFALSPNFSPANDGWVTLEWNWVATTSFAFFGLSAQNTTTGQKTWIDEFHVTPQSTTCVDAVRAVLDLAGVGAPLQIDGTEQLAVMPGPMVWALTDASPVTWLQIANDLLGAINYRDLWVDQDGTFRSEPWQDPKTLPVEWTFDLADLSTNIVGSDAVEDEDVWGKPNWWRFVRRGMTTTPTEGDGIYTTQNQTRGPSSQVSLGRIVHKTVFVDAVDQAALEAQGDRIVTEDTSVTRTVTLNVDPLPIAGHLDVVSYVNQPVSAKAQAVRWQINLDGSPGQWVLEVLE